MEPATEETLQSVNDKLKNNLGQSLTFLTEYYAMEQLKKNKCSASTASVSYVGEPHADLQMACNNANEKFNADVKNPASYVMDIVTSNLIVTEKNGEYIAVVTAVFNKQ